MPTQLGGVVPDRAGWQREFDARMERAVRKTGRTPRSPGPLTASEASCRTAECLARVAEAAGVDIVLGARVTADRGSPPSYKLVVDRYDRDRPGSVRTEDAECSVCTEVEAAERLEAVAASLMPAMTIVPPPKHTVVEERVIEQPIVIIEEHPHRERNLKIGIALTSVLAAGGIVMLGVGGKALSINGDPVSRVPGATYGPDRYATLPMGAGLVAAGAVVTVGALIGLGFEIHALGKRDRK